MGNRVLRSGLMALLALLVCAAPVLARGYDMTVEVPVAEREPIPPICETWHELWPVVCNYYHQDGYLDNGDMVISYCDFINLNFQWYHIEAVREYPDRIEIDVVKVDKITQAPVPAPPTPPPFPNCEIWHEIEPDFCVFWHQEDYIDNGDGVISRCDYMKLEGEWYHVVAVQYNEYDSYTYLGLKRVYPSERRIYLDVDPPWKVHEIHPTPSVTFDVYVCLDCFGPPPEHGTRGTAFLFDRTFNGFKLGQFSLMGGLDFGDVEVDGWTLAAGAECVYPDQWGVACVGYVTYLYLGPDPGQIQLLPHPGTGREVLDCDFNSGFYCIYANLGVSMPPPEGEPGCECEAPAAVQPTTWGKIKAQYR